MSNYRHGHRSPRSGTYISWQSMIARCTKENHPRYNDYGGRGIQVDPRWVGRGGFLNFLTDLGERPLGKTLDRKDVNGHYVKSNCQWATIEYQRWNRRDMVDRSPEVPPEYHVQAAFDIPDTIAVNVEISIPF